MSDSDRANRAIAEGVWRDLPAKECSAIGIAAVALALKARKPVGDVLSLDQTRSGLDEYMSADLADELRRRDLDDNELIDLLEIEVPNEDDSCDEPVDGGAATIDDDEDAIALAHRLGAWERLSFSPWLRRDVLVALGFARVLERIDAKLSSGEGAVALAELREFLGPRPPAAEAER